MKFNYNEYLKNSNKILYEIKLNENHKNYIENELKIIELKKEIENIKDYIKFIENKENEIFIIDLKETFINNLMKINKRNNLKYQYKNYLDLKYNYLSIKILLNKKLLKCYEYKRKNLL